MARRARGTLLSVCMTVLFLSRAAGAAPDDKPIERIYDDARAAFDKGDYDRACPLFLEYYEVNSVPAALFTVAECEARWGKPARALEHFEMYARQTADAPASPVQEQRARMAYEQIAKLSALVAKVTPVLASAVHGSVVVKLDGLPVPMPADHAVVVEPGEHLLELTTEDGTRTQKRFTVGTGEARRIEIGGAPAESEGPKPPPPPEEASSSRRLTVPVVIAGTVGATGLVIGGVFGGLALGARSDIHAHCIDRACDAQGLDAADRGKSLATVSTIGFAVGVVGLAAAVVLYFVQPTGARAVGARF